MAWVRLDDAMPHHPKVMAAGVEAFALDVAAIAYSNRFGTDGFIGDDMLPAVLPCLRSPRKAATRLCTVNRWMRDDERGGWLIHDVADYQPSAAEQEAERAKARERMRRLRAGGRSGERPPNVRANSRRSSDDVPDPVPSRPEEQPTETPSSTDVDTDDDGFGHFWTVWPERNGKKLAQDKAHRAWSRLTLPERRDAYRGAVNYAAASEAGMAGAKDAFRWLQGREWPDWQEPAVPSVTPKGPPRPPDGDVDYTAGWDRQEASSP